MNKSLEYIIRVSEEGNINKAAEKLYITPSALSKFVITKEKELGVKLFDRSGKKFVLTYAGERYIDWAKRLLHMQESMEREIQSISEDKSGIVRFGFQLMQSKILFTKIIPEFKKMCPDIDIVLESSHSQELMRMLDEGLIEFAITTHREKLEQFEYLRINQIEIALIVPKDHAIVEDAIKKDGFRYPWVDAKKLKEETFVSLYKEQEPRKVMDEFFENSGIAPKVNMQVHTTELTILSVANNFGITIGYDLPARLEEFRSSVELLSFGKKPIVRDLSIICKKGFVPRGYEEEIFDLCKKYYKIV